MAGHDVWIGSSERWGQRPDGSNVSTNNNTFINKRSLERFDHAFAVPLKSHVYGTTLANFRVSVSECRKVWKTRRHPQGCWPCDVQSDLWSRDIGGFGVGVECGGDSGEVF